MPRLLRPSSLEAVDFPAGIVGKMRFSDEGRAACIVADERYMLVSQPSLVVRYRPGQLLQSLYKLASFFRLHQHLALFKRYRLQLVHLHPHIRRLYLFPSFFRTFLLPTLLLIRRSNKRIN